MPKKNILQTKKHRASDLLLLLLTVLWIIFIWSRSCRPADLSAAESGGLLTLFRNILNTLGILSPIENSPFAFLVSDHFIRKTAHFVEFALLGILSTVTAKRFLSRFSLLSPLLLSVSVACIDEFLQRFFEGRSAQLSDVLLDTAGILTGIALLLLVIRLHQILQSRKAKSK